MTRDLAATFDAYLHDAADGHWQHVTADEAGEELDREHDRREERAMERAPDYDDDNDTVLKQGRQ